MTRVEALQPVGDGRWAVLAGGVVLAKLFPDSLTDLGLAVGVTLDPVAREHVVLRDAEDAARAEALRLLAAAPRSRTDLMRRLARRGHAAAAVAGALGRLEAQGWLDDTAYGRARAAARLARAPRGVPALAADLAARGVEPALARTLAQEAVEEAGGEATLAAQALARWLARKAGPPTADDARRWAARLQRRGFASAAVAAAFRLHGLPWPGGSGPRPGSP